MNTSGSFFPRRVLSGQEWLWVPVVLYHLSRAYALVRWVPARYWLPATLRAVPESAVPTPAQQEMARLLAVLLQGATRRLPWHSTCLMNALATWQILYNQGISAQMQLGVKPDAVSGLGAHAWLLVGEELLVGGKEAPDFRVIGKPNLATELKSI